MEIETRLLCTVLGGNRARGFRVKTEILGRRVSAVKLVDDLVGEIPTRCLWGGSSRAICSDSHSQRQELSEVPGLDSGVGLSPQTLEAMGTTATLDEDGTRFPSALQGYTTASTSSNGYGKKYGASGSPP